MTGMALIEMIVRISTAAAVVLAVLKFSRDSGMVQKRITDAIETAERVGTLVEGNPKEHADQQKRDGVLGRLKDVEHREKSAQNAAKLLGDEIEQLWKRFRAVLRGMGVPSDISNNDKLERAIKKKIAETRYPIDRLGAGLAMQEHPTGPHQIVTSHSSLRLPSGDRASSPDDRYSPPVERVPRPYQPPIPRRDDDEDVDSDPPEDE